MMSDKELEDGILALQTEVTNKDSAIFILRGEAIEYKRQATNWEESARQYHRNTQYYRNLLVKIGETIGSESYVADDGSISEDILCAKLPELVTALQEEVAKAKNNLKISEEHSDAIVDGFDKLQKEVVRLDLALGIIRDLTEDGEVDADVINEIFRIADQSLPYEPKEQYENVTRFEVIDHSEDGSGREIVKHKIKVKLSLQDKGRTLKVFLEDR